MHMGMKLPALLARFPKPFWWRPDPDQPWDNDWPVLPEDADESYPQLVPDFNIWRDGRDGVEKTFRRLDHDAQLLQQQFWRQQVTLIAGGLLATALGAFQAADGGGNRGVAAALAVLAGLLTGLTALVRARRAQQGYLTARLKAERIKSEYYEQLSRVVDWRVCLCPGGLRHEEVGAVGQAAQDGVCCGLRAEPGGVQDVLFECADVGELVM
jgi:hypothetical protein